MPKLPLSYQQHRQTIGNHTSRQDRNQKSQKYQDDYIQHLAQIPGRHTDNICRQDIAYATLQLFAILSSVRNCSSNPAVTAQRTNELKTTKRMLVAETSCGSPIAAPMQQSTINRNNYLAAEIQQKALLKPPYPDAPISDPTAGLICNGLNTMLHSVSNVFYETSQCVFRDDPLRFPMAVVYSFPQKIGTDTQNVEHVIIEDIDGGILNLTSSSCSAMYQATDCNFIKNSQDSLIQYYKDYYAKYPNLKQLIASNLKEKISTHFHMDIDPDNVRFMSIHNIPDQEKEKIHFSEQFENKTLTEWFFINFKRNIQNNAQNIDVLLKFDNTKTMNLSKLLKLVDEIDFYNDVKEKLSKSFQDKEIHIKKYFIDFICHLDISGINNESVEDVLSGVGVIPGRTVYTSLLNINGYIASTAFCFWNESGRLTLYFPGSAFKFIAFQNEAEMREWLFRAWSQQSQRNMIASHFENGRNNVLHSEISERLGVTRQDTKIATERIYIPYDRFFVYLFNQIKDETMFDLAVILKLGTTFRKNIWEKMMNIPNITPNLTSLFSSLNIHLNLMIDAHTYNKKRKEWCTIKRNFMDTVAMSMLDKIMKFPYKGGYDFINIVIKSIQTVDIRRLKSTSEQDIKKGQNFIRFGQEYLTEFYDDYNLKYPGLKILARSVLKEKIQERFHLDIDPDTVRFVHFDNVEYGSRGKIHDSNILENKTLTEWLFTNFDVETQDNLQDMDAVCGIYDTSVWSTKKQFRGSDELKIKPTDFIQLVYDIDFYNYAKNKFTEWFKNKDVHIKKYFLDFVNHLSGSHIKEEAAKDVQAGVGIGKGRKVWVSLFDINGYPASNAFIFRSENYERITLYFPGSTFKFISFRRDFEVRLWVANACAIPERRAMIASHFTIANRQDGTFYYGVDAWLDSIAMNPYYHDRIIRKSHYVESEVFFDYLFHQIKEKTFSDLDSLIKSSAEIRRDMWEEMIDASNIIPNPISGFLSLVFHLEHAIDADTYEEKQQEWNKIKSDAVNLVVMVTLSKAMSFPDKQGYEFIDLVNKDVEIGNINQGIGIAEMNPESIFQPDSPYRDWLLSQLIYDEAQVTYDITSFMAPLKTFLPLREVRISNDISIVDSEIRMFLESHYQQYQFDTFYGLDAFNDNVPVYIQRAAVKIKVHLNKVREHLRSVSYKFHTGKYEDDIKQFLSLVVESEDERVLNQIYSRLQIMVMRALEFLNKCEIAQDFNIALVSSKQTLNPTLPFLYQSAITDPDVLDALPYGFVYNTDPLRRIHILLDRMVDSPEERNIFIDKDNLMYDTFVHETSHLSSNTADLFYFDSIKGGTMQENVQFMLSRFNRAMARAEANSAFRPFRNFMEIIKQYFGDRNGITDADLLYKIRTDPMLKANVIMENADTFVLCVREIAKIGLDERVKREDKNISDYLVNFYLASVFAATHNHHINTQAECK